ncbi:insulin-like growth factor-binding protein 1 [Pantherophis guttatus]|uniref:Insulin-like growth factor-binding protein 1 n=1 Tax=Pantherophis guttatus TaxID=94885 RepID=A0A6P9BXB7_PANGU|nr:insulin-like growth factor-binding protein 1 [Pantherophis guttatus]
MTYPGFSCQLLLLFLAPGFSLGAALHLMHCAPCTEEKLRLCPPVSASCPETSRQPGCSCCHSCALQLGEPCGIYTARCSQGLSCQVQVDQARPLYVLTQGQGTCLPIADRTETAESVEPEDLPTEGDEITADHLVNYEMVFSADQDKSASWDANNIYENLRAKNLAEVKKWREQGPCQKELYKALDKLAKAQQTTGEQLYRFYLPNCNKNGFYHSKQCETSLDGNPANCWCVYPKNGKRITESPEMMGNPECEQFISSQK